MNTKIKDRLEYLRGEIVAERISYGEIMELQGLKAHIAPDDVLLLQWAGVPEKHKHAAAVALGSIKSAKKAQSSRDNGAKPARPGSNPRGRPKGSKNDSGLGFGDGRHYKSCASWQGKACNCAEINPTLKIVADSPLQIQPN